jgi:hypothetical protein
MKTLINSIAASFFLLITSCQTGSVKSEVVKSEDLKKPDSISVGRGKYLVATMGCEDCHSPKKMGPRGPEVIEELRFSGYQANRPIQNLDKKNLALGWVLMSPDLNTAVGPWGQSFAANISSDPTGIGNWEEENFLVSMKEGKSKGLKSGRGLLPPMPWQGIGQLNDNDLKSIFAFLKTTNPVNNIAPANIPPSLN